MLLLLPAGDEGGEVELVGGGAEGLGTVAQGRMPLTRATPLPSVLTRILLKAVLRFCR